MPVLEKAEELDKFKWRTRVAAVGFHYVQTVVNLIHLYKLRQDWGCVQPGL